MPRSRKKSKRPASSQVTAEEITAPQDDDVSSAPSTSRSMIDIINRRHNNVNIGAFRNLKKKFNTDADESDEEEIAFSLPNHDFDLMSQWDQISQEIEQEGDGDVINFDSLLSDVAAQSKEGNGKQTFRHVRKREDILKGLKEHAARLVYPPSSNFKKLVLEKCDSSDDDDNSEHLNSEEFQSERKKPRLNTPNNFGNSDEELNVPEDFEMENNVVTIGERIFSDGFEIEMGGVEDPPEIPPSTGLHTREKEDIGSPTSKKFKSSNKNPKSTQMPGPSFSKKPQTADKATSFGVGMGKEASDRTLKMSKILMKAQELIEKQRTTSRERSKASSSGENTRSLLTPPPPPKTTEAVPSTSGTPCRGNASSLDMDDDLEIIEIKREAVSPIPEELSSMPEEPTAPENPTVDDESSNSSNSHSSNSIETPDVPDVGNNNTSAKSSECAFIIMSTQSQRSSFSDRKSRSSVKNGSNEQQVQKQNTISSLKSKEPSCSQAGTSNAIWAIKSNEPTASSSGSKKLVSTVIKHSSLLDTLKPTNVAAASQTTSSAIKVQVITTQSSKPSGKAAPAPLSGPAITKVSSAAPLVTETAKTQEQTSSNTSTSKPNNITAPVYKNGNEIRGNEDIVGNAKALGQISGSQRPSGMPVETLKQSKDSIQSVEAQKQVISNQNLVTPRPVEAPKPPNSGPPSTVSESAQISKQSGSQLNNTISGTIIQPSSISVPVPTEAPKQNNSNINMSQPSTEAPQTSNQHKSSQHSAVMPKEGSSVHTSTKTAAVKQIGSNGHLSGQPVPETPKPIIIQNQPSKEPDKTPNQTSSSQASASMMPAEVVKQSNIIGSLAGSQQSSLGRPSTETSATPKQSNINPQTLALGSHAIIVNQKSITNQQPSGSATSPWPMPNQDHLPNKNVTAAPKQSSSSQPPMEQPTISKPNCNNQNSTETTATTRPTVGVQQPLPGSSKSALGPGQTQSSQTSNLSATQSAKTLIITTQPQPPVASIQPPGKNEGSQSQPSLESSKTLQLQPSSGTQSQSTKVMESSATVSANKGLTEPIKQQSSDNQPSTKSAEIPKQSTTTIRRPSSSLCPTPASNPKQLPKPSDEPEPSRIRKQISSLLTDKPLRPIPATESKTVSSPLEPGPGSINQPPTTPTPVLEKSTPDLKDSQAKVTSQSLPSSSGTTKLNAATLPAPTPSLPESSKPKPQPVPTVIAPATAAVGKSSNPSMEAEVKKNIPGPSNSEKPPSKNDPVVIANTKPIETSKPQSSAPVVVPTVVAISKPTPTVKDPTGPETSEVKPKELPSKPIAAPAVKTDNKPTSIPLERPKTTPTALENPKTHPTPLLEPKTTPTPQEKPKTPSSLPTEKAKTPPTPLENPKAHPTPLQESKTPPTPAEIPNTPPTPLEKSKTTPPAPLEQPIRPSTPLQESKTHPTPPEKPKTAPTPLEKSKTTSTLLEKPQTPSTLLKKPNTTPPAPLEKAKTAPPTEKANTSTSQAKPSERPKHINLTTSAEIALTLDPVMPRPRTGTPSSEITEVCSPMSEKLLDLDDLKDSTTTDGGSRSSTPGECSESPNVKPNIIAPVSKASQKYYSPPPSSCTPGAKASGSASSSNSSSHGSSSSFGSGGTSTVISSLQQQRTTTTPTKEAQSRSSSPSNNPVKTLKGGNVTLSSFPIIGNGGSVFTATSKSSFVEQTVLRRNPIMNRKQPTSRAANSVVISLPNATHGSGSPATVTRPPFPLHSLILTAKSFSQSAARAANKFSSSSPSPPSDFKGKLNGNGSIGSSRSPSITPSPPPPPTIQTTVAPKILDRSRSPVASTMGRNTTATITYTPSSNGSVIMSEPRKMNNMDSQRESLTIAQVHPTSTGPHRQMYQQQQRPNNLVRHVTTTNKSNIRDEGASEYSTPTHPKKAGYSNEVEWKRTTVSSSSSTPETVSRPPPKRPSLLPPPPKLIPRPPTPSQPSSPPSPSPPHPVINNGIGHKLGGPNSALTITLVSKKTFMIPPSPQPAKRIDPIFECPVCQEEFLCYDDNLFKAHVVIKHGIEIIEDKHFSLRRKPAKALLECRKCRIYVSNDATDEHRAACPHKPSLYDSPYVFVEVEDERLLKHECGLCSKSFSARYELRRHIDGSHKHLMSKIILYPGFRCAQCLKAFSSSSDLTKHCQDCREQCPKPETISEVAKRFLHCDLCNREHANTTETDNCFTDKEFLRCLLCFDVYKVKDNFYKHLRAHHGLQLMKGHTLTLACPFCNCGDQVNWGKYTDIFPHILADHYQPVLQPPTLQDALNLISFSHALSARRLATYTTSNQTDK